MKGLTRFDYLVLAVTGWGGATAYELEQACIALGLAFGYSRSHLYSTPARLEAQGLLHSAEEPGSTRGRTRYRLTDDGASALAEWMKSPTPTLALEEEVFARLATGDLVLYTDTAKSLEASIEPTEEKIVQLEFIRRSMGRQYATIPEKLAIQLRIDLLRTYLHWLSHAAKELNRPGTRPSSTAGPGVLHGRHHTEYVDEVKELRRNGLETEAQRLLVELIDAMEAEAYARKLHVAPWYYEQLAISYRKTSDVDAEIAVLERYCGLAPARATKLAKRLQDIQKREHERKRRERERQARSRAGKSVSERLEEARARLRKQGLLD